MGLGGASALLAKLSVKSGPLAKALVISTSNCEDATERRAAGGASKAVISKKAEKFVRVPLEESTFSARVVRAKVQLVSAVRQ